MVLGVVMRPIERRGGALHRIAATFHFNLLAYALDAPSVAAQFVAPPCEEGHL